MKYQGHIVDVVNRQIFDGEIEVENGIITAVTPAKVGGKASYILPGFIDSHVHIESSMMVPAEFARVAAEHGTIGIVTDPHEIANVLGEEGIDFMIRSGRHIRFNFCFGAPSCVPSCSTDIETCGEILDSQHIEQLMAREEIGYLSEMMNYPGVLNRDREVMAKIQAAQKHGKPVDGHAPGLTGSARMTYANAGISTDHECASLEEGRSCIEAGMKVLIREGSAARDYESLIPLLRDYPDSIMFCTDDCHPSDLIRGHINKIVARALKDGYDFWHVMQAACVNPQKHYNLNWGLLQPGDPANFICTDSLEPGMRIQSTFIKGKEVYNYNSFLSPIQSQAKSIENQMAILDNYPNKFMAQPITAQDIQFTLHQGDTAHIILARDGSLLTGHEEVTVTGNPLEDALYPWHTVQKIVVYNRYQEGAKPVVGLIRGFNLKDGAMAASIAHDCHNIVAIGSSDEYLVRAINRVIEMKGGEVALNSEELIDLALPIAGLISPLSGHEVAHRSVLLREVIQKAGCQMKAPFITMSFMCLPVIPDLKLTDKGLFDSKLWKFI